MPATITGANIEKLVQRFLNRELPAAEWTHEAHLITALYFLKKYSKDEATCWLRGGITAYNASLGNRNSPTAGYHETMTLFWIEVIHAFIQKHPDLDLTELCHRFLASPWANKTLPVQYYRKSRLMSTRARARWVEPDRRAFDF